MAMIKFETQNAFLQKVFFDYWKLWKDYFLNLKNYLIWLTIPLMIISIPFYLVFTIFYGIYLVLSFAQDFDNDIMKHVQEISAKMDLFSKYVAKMVEIHRMAQHQKYY